MPRRRDPEADPRTAEFEAALAGMDGDQLRQLVGHLLSAGAEQTLPAAAPPPPPLPDPPDEVRMLRVRVDLQGASPPIWRRLELAGDLHLDVVHRVLQVAMGWTDSHLHAFSTDPARGRAPAQRFLTSFDVEEGEEGVEEADVRLDQVLVGEGDVLVYEYDFGDGWKHRIVLEQSRSRVEAEPRARCLQGRRACPLDDVGGIDAWNALVGVLAGRTVPDEHTRELLAWLPEGFDPAELDLAAIAARLPFALLDDTEAPEGLSPSVVDLLRALGPDVRPLVEHLVARAAPDPAATVDPADAAEMVRPFTRFLERVGPDGLPLSSAGYLPPPIVDEVLEMIGQDGEWPGQGNREHLTYPVLAFRESTQHLGLVRKHRGRLLLTPAGRACVADPRLLWEHVAARLPLGRDEAARLAGTVALLVLAAQDPIAPGVDETVQTVLGALGWRTQRGTIDGTDAGWLAAPTVSVLALLGVDTRWSSTQEEADPAPQSASALAFLRRALASDGG